MPMTWISVHVISFGSGRLCQMYLFSGFFSGPVSSGCNQFQMWSGFRSSICQNTVHICSPNQNTVHMVILFQVQYQISISGFHIGMTIWVRVPDTRRVPDLTGMGARMIFYLRVTPVPDLNRDGYEMCIFFHPWVTRRVPDTLLLI
jgi:hypothetical protein